MTATSGRKCIALSESAGPLGLLEKMLLGSSSWASTMRFLTWKASTTPAGHLLFRLVPSRPRTNGCGSGLWATPQAAQATARREGTWNGTYMVKGDGKKAQTRLVDQVAYVPEGEMPQMWRTPQAANATQGPKSPEHFERVMKTGESCITLTDQVRMFPTPTVQDASNNGGPSQHKRNSKPLNAHVGGRLNPEWVEWLMGYPIGWTGCGPSVTP